MRDKTAQDNDEASERKYGDDQKPEAKVTVEGLYKIATNLNHGLTIQMDTNSMAEPRIVTLWPDNNTLQNLWRITYEAEYSAHIITNQHNVRERSLFSMMYLQQYAQFFFDHNIFGILIQRALACMLLKINIMVAFWMSVVPIQELVRVLSSGPIKERQIRYLN